jgi:peptidoglycan/LPS O-acetylase OafA/YrhL
MKATKHRFDVLDALRGVAACLVTLFHFLHGYVITHFDGIGFFEHAYLMVDFFFVLSGFVISYAALGKVTNGRTAGIFLIRRFGRVWPLHMTVLAIFVFIVVAKSIISHGAIPAFSPIRPASSIIYHALMIQPLSIVAAWQWNVPSWSISLEFYTYFIFAGVCLLAERWRFSTLGPALALILLSLALMPEHFLLAALVPGTIFRCIYSFFIGHVTYLFWQRRKSHVPALELLAAGLAITFVSYGDIRLLQFFVPPVFAFFIWVFAAEAGLLSRLGKTPVMQNLGLWSYSIYMTHFLAIHIFQSNFPAIMERLGIEADFGSKWMGDALVLLYMATVVAVSSLTYRWIENPARNYFNRLAGGGARVSRSGSAA